MDSAKLADLVLLLIDGDFGFEMETFEFLNILQVHGFPKVMGVLTNLDKFKDPSRLRKTKKTLKQRFWTEIHAGAKLFYLSGMARKGGLPFLSLLFLVPPGFFPLLPSVCLFPNAHWLDLRPPPPQTHGRYNKRDTLNLARFISIAKFRPLTWRQQHPYVVGDRFEDMTDPEAVRQDSGCSRTVALYGYVRGANLKPGMQMHLCGVGDVSMAEAAALPDPCPLPDKVKKRSLDGKERLLYAPMSDVGRLVYDKDAMYINLPDHQVNFTRPSADDGGDGVDHAVQTPGVGMVRSLQARPGARLGSPSLAAFCALPCGLLRPRCWLHESSPPFGVPLGSSAGHPAGSRRKAEGRAHPGLRVVRRRGRERRRGRRQRVERRGGRGRGRGAARSDARPQEGDVQRER